MNNPLKAIRFEKLLPRKELEDTEKNIAYAQISIDNPVMMIREIMFISLIVAAIAAFITYKLVMPYVPAKILILLVIGEWFGLWLAIPMLFSSILAFLADNIADKIDKVLPDALLLMAANLKSGVIPEQAFLATVRPQFGPLNPLLRYAAIQVESGRTFEQALLEMGTLSSSQSLNQATRIIAEGVRSGAELSRILESLANDLLANENLRAQMKAEIKSYQLFIILTSLIAAPLLYGVASFLLQVMAAIASKAPTTTNMPMNANLGILSNFHFGGIYIPSNLLVLTYVINLLVLAVSTALINAELMEGRIRNGLKYIPLYISIVLAIFFGIRYAGPIILQQFLHTSIASLG
jgi:Flp pilus assembly protein TadB